MKRLLAFCLALALLCLGGCSGAEEDKMSSVSEEPITITVPDNLYEPDFFTGLYQKIGDKLGAGDEDFMSFDKLRFFFSSDGSLLNLDGHIYTKIPTVENPQSSYTDHSYTAYQLDSNLFLPSLITLDPTDELFTPERSQTEADKNYAKFREQMSFLSEINLGEIIRKYAVGSPASFALCSQPINGNYEDDFVESGIFLDCTDPSDVKQVEPKPFSASLPYEGLFDGVKLYYAIYPYYEPDLTAEEMDDWFYDKTDWDHIIVLMIRGSITWKRPTYEATELEEYVT